MSSAIDRLRSARDFIFPWPHPESPEYLAKRAERSKATQAYEDEMVNAIPNDALLQAVTGCSNLLIAEDARRQSAETRLTSIIGLSSIAGTLVFGTIIAQTGVLRPAHVRWAFVPGALYLTLQICSAILAAVKGLARRGYRAPVAADVLPLATESQSAQLRRQITTCLRAVEEAREHNNDKVTQMAVAHRAMQNFVSGLAALAVLATYESLALPRGDDFLDRLKSNHELQELLRGPKGDAGPPGPAGCEPQIGTPNDSKSPRPPANGPGAHP